MTPFELWRAGEGPEPVVVVELPAPWGQPWKGRRSTWRWHAVNYGLDAYGREKAEEAEAVEEMRAALEAAVTALPRLRWRFTCPYDAQQCEHPRCLVSPVDQRCAERRAAASPDGRYPCAP